MYFALVNETLITPPLSMPFKEFLEPQYDELRMYMIRPENV